MKKLIFICTILISCCTNSFYANNKNIDTHDNFTSSYSLLVEQSTKIIKKNAGLIACMPFLIYYHKNIFDLFSDHPIISGCCLYFLIHYICDCILQYKEQKPLFDCIPLVKKMALDLVICHGVRNYAYQKKLAITFATDDQTFFNSLTEDMHYTFYQIEYITLTIYTKLKERLNELQQSIPIESEEFVFLSHPSFIDIQTILYLTKNHPDLHTMISNFEKNPADELEPLIDFLKDQLHRNFEDIQHRLVIQNFTDFSTS